MTARRRIGAPEAKNRAILLDAAEQLMLDEGYAAVTSRRVAEKAGLKPQLVHYYFRAMDDLFLEVFRRRAEEGLERQAEVLDSPRPLHALWEFSTDPAGTALTMEFAALANHRKALRAEIARYGERFRQREIEVISGVLARYGVEQESVPPAVLTVLVRSISLLLVMENVIGMSGGHAETVAFIEEIIRRYEGEPVSTEPPGGRGSSA